MTQRSSLQDVQEAMQKAVRDAEEFDYWKASRIAARTAREHGWSLKNDWSYGENGKREMTCSLVPIDPELVQIHLYPKEG